MTGESNERIRAEKVESTPVASANAENERVEILRRLHEWLEFPLSLLGFVWIALLVKEFVSGLGPLLERATYLIWGAFVVDFAVRFLLAPRKIPFLRDNVVTMLSLAVPALRALRLFGSLRLLRAGSAMRGVRMARLLGSINRGMRALDVSMRRKGAAYAAASTIVVTLAGAAGMLAFEGPTAEEGGFDDYGGALWWTAMLMTTMGSEYWPRTVEGRLLCLFLAVYAFAVFGYVTAALASFFVGRDADASDGELAGEAAVERLRVEIAALAKEVTRLNDKIDRRGGTTDREE